MVQGTVDIDKSANGHLLSLCYRDGTPEQARHAVGTIAALYNPKNSKALTQEQHDSFSQVLQSLTSPSRLIAPLKGKSTRLVTILVALAELTQHAPNVFDSTRGQKAIHFSLEMILLGRAHPSNTSDTSDEDEANAKPSPSKRSRKVESSQGQGKHHSPSGCASTVEDSSLSVTCRTLCAAIEFLVSYIRATIMSSNEPASQGDPKSTPGLSDVVTGKVFEILSQILRDSGMPPSCQDRNECGLRQDRAALRQCASIHLLRLCDPRLGLDVKFLTTERWHVLAGAFLDDEKAVRGALMTELSLMLTGNGQYGNFGRHRAMVPLLRLVALIVLCVDGDQSLGHAMANGNAANVGKKASSIKAHAKGCIVALRKAYEVSAAHARANGPETEKKFEATMKVALMPEFVVPYAMHLLAFRRETPQIYAKTIDVTETAATGEMDEVGHRVLRKRLRSLFDPLVLSLGDSADNISFLLRMTEIIGKYYPIRNSKRDSTGGKFSFSAALDDEKVSREVQCLVASKLHLVCEVAREVLLSYVKKDVNLAVYPGKITLPAHLFHRRATRGHSGTTTTSQANKHSHKLDRPLGSSMNPEMDATAAESSSRFVASQVSRESVETPPSKNCDGTTHSHSSLDPSLLSVKGPTASFGGLSPIRKALPVSGKNEAILLSSGEKTRGTTPPSVVRNTRFSASASSAIEGTSATASPFMSKVSESSKTNQSPDSDIRVSTEHSRKKGSSSKVGTTSKASRKRHSLVDHPLEQKRPKGRLPAQIKILRNNAKPSQRIEKLIPSRTRGAQRKPKFEADFDFSVDHADGVAKTQTKQGKENQGQTKLAPRRSKRGLNNV